MRQFADRIWVGGIDAFKPGAARIDVRSLPENPYDYLLIPRMDVDDVMWEIEDYVDKTPVLITCQDGVNRAPSVARLYCIGRGWPFNIWGSFPVEPWKQFTMHYWDYYRNRQWHDILEEKKEPEWYGVD